MGRSDTAGWRNLDAYDRGQGEGACRSGVALSVCRWRRSLLSANAAEKLGQDTYQTKTMSLAVRSGLPAR